MPNEADLIRSEVFLVSKKLVEACQRWFGIGEERPLGNMDGESHFWTGEKVGGGVRFRGRESFGPNGHLASVSVSEGSLSFSRFVELNGRLLSDSYWVIDFASGSVLDFGGVTGSNPRLVERGLSEVTMPEMRQVLADLASALPRLDIWPN